MTDVSPSTDSGSGSPLGILTRKVGPLPGWAWIAVAVAGYAVWKLYRNKAGTVTNAAADATNGTDTPNVPAGDASSAGGIGVSGDGSGIVSTTPVGPVTNAQWGTTAARILIAADPAHANVISNALQKYVSQDKAGLNAEERAVVQKAITQLGPPPQGLLRIISATSTPAKPPVKPGPKPEPPKYRSYTTKHGDTFRSLSVKFYGSVGGGNDIQSANPSLSHYSVTDKLPSGRVLRIPVRASIYIH